MSHLFSLSSYDYELPAELIAQKPSVPRDSSKLMVIDRSSQTIETRVFSDLYHILGEKDFLLFNDSKVIPARLFGRKEKTDARIEIFLLKKIDGDTWKAILRPAKRVHEQTTIFLNEKIYCIAMKKEDEGHFVIQFRGHASDEEILELGKMPLPPYIKREVEKKDFFSYQTIYAKSLGSVAAPTAGLHFTSSLLQKLEEKGVKKSFLTLHVGLGTFLPVKKEDIRQHTMHKEKVVVSQETAKTINFLKRDHRVICVGSTSLRALESIAKNEEIEAGSFDTGAYIYPGYQFKCADALLTNFHLPKSSLLMLVAAFAGYDLMKKAYEKAIKERWRFYSYGDAMLIL